MCSVCGEKAVEARKSIADTAVDATAAAGMNAFQQLFGSIKRVSYVVKRWISAIGARWGHPNAGVPATSGGDDFGGKDDNSGDGVR
jgi:hypothetical protein